jgi:NitT/TauT family transport system ATP-binding protein
VSAAVSTAGGERRGQQEHDFVFSCRSVSLKLPYQGGNRWILQDISLDIRRGELLTIVGPSGTGKTSLIRVLGGLTSCTSGSVLINGEEIAGPPEGVIIVFQDYSHALLQWRTVFLNVALGIEGRIPAPALRARVLDALRLVGLEKNKDDYPWQLSGGMQQRVQIARALAVRPAVLLMDEPFAALDAMTKASLQDELLRVKQETGCSIAFITHDIEEAVYLGDRIAVINGAPGRIERTFDVTLPKPRDQILTRQLTEFLKFRYAVHQAIGGIV